jgi:hypothetical protein
MALTPRSRSCTRWRFRGPIPLRETTPYPWFFEESSGPDEQGDYLFQALLPSEVDVRSIWPQAHHVEAINRPIVILPDDSPFLRWSP